MIIPKVNILILNNSYDKAYEILVENKGGIPPILFHQKYIEIALKSKSQRYINKLFAELALSA